MGSVSGRTTKSETVFGVDLAFFGGGSAEGAIATVVGGSVGGSRGCRGFCGAGLGARCAVWRFEEGGVSQGYFRVLR